MIATYTLTADGGIRCAFCGRVSYHYLDRAERYCGACHLFHAAVRIARHLHADGGTHECDEWRTAIDTCAVCDRVLEAVS